MFLRRLELHGFKSFGERTKLEFGRGITAVVGPNGSGKSNIADGIRWVLGEQSARSLRGDTMQDVIFAGSDGKGPLGMASVSLTLGDCEGCLGLEFDEITVTRKVFRSGESEFSINKAACRLKDIRDLFRDTGLGQDGYSQIGQGQIDAILLARPEERRLIIEEAAGIGKYRVRKTEATRKLSDTKANSIRLDDIINELERQLEPLRKAAVRAETYLTISEEYRAKGQAMCAYEWSELGKEDQELTQKEKHLLALLNSMEEQQRHEQTIIAALRQEIEALESRLDSLQNLHTKAIEDLGEVGRRKDMAQERLNHAEGDSSRLRNELSKHEQKRQEVRKDLAACLWRLRSLRRGRAEALRRMEGLIKTQNEGQSQRQSLLNEMEKIRVAEANTRQMRSEMQADLEAGESRKALWQEQATVLSHRLEEIRRQEDAIEIELIRQKEALSETKRQLASGRSLLSEHRKLHDELHSRWSQKQEIVRSLQEELQVQSSRLQVLSEMEKEYAGYYPGVKAVLRAREDLPGICGVVAELLRVPKELETAIEVALGSGLQNIVTESDVGARAAINYLKEKQAGRATFLPLDGLRFAGLSHRDRARLEGANVVGVASELIGYDAKYESMVRYLLGRVVVAKDLDAAVALSRSLHSFARLVTLDGDTISPGGAITGGSLSRRDTSGLLQRRQEVSRLTEAIEAGKASLDVERKAAQGLEGGLHRTDLETKALAEQLHQIELHIKELEKEVALGKSEITRWEREAARVKAEMEGLETRLADEVSEKEERLKRLSDLEEEAALWQNGLLAVETKLAALDRDQADTQQKYTASKVDIATIESHIQAGEKEAARYRESLKELVHLADAVREALREVGLEKQTLQSDIEQMRLEYQKLKSDLGQIDDRLLVEGRHRKDKQEELWAREQGNKDRQQAREAVQEELADVRRGLDKIAMKKARLTEVMWDDYGLQPDSIADLELPDGDAHKIRGQVRNLRRQLQSLGPVDTETIAQYAVVRERHDYLQRQRQDLIEAEEQLIQVIDEMDAVSGARFRETLDRVQGEFQDIFVHLFGGGSAKLILTEADELEAAGLEISVRPPGKRPQNLNLLSGGERALTAISLLFALLRVKPSPFCVLDEIDASLDESNLDRFTALLKDFGQDTQLIVITHRPITMEAADTLYGVTMNKANISQLVSVQLDEAAAGFEEVSSEVW